MLKDNSLRICSREYFYKQYFLKTHFQKSLKITCFSSFYCFFQILLRQFISNYRAAKKHFLQDLTLIYPNLRKSKVIIFYVKHFLIHTPVSGRLHKPTMKIKFTIHLQLQNHPMRHKNGTHTLRILINELNEARFYFRRTASRVCFQFDCFPSISCQFISLELLDAASVHKALRSELIQA